MKSSGIIKVFHMHFSWLCGSWNNHRLLKKLSFWRNYSRFSSEVSKLTSVKYPWNDAFSSMTKIDFYPYCPIIVIVLTKFSLYFIEIIFWSFFETIKYPKVIFCFLESLFYQQIKLISHRSVFWHTRRKTVVIFSKLKFFKILF